MPNTTWTFDPNHTTVDFRIRHAAISWVRGSFSKWSGRLEFDPTSPQDVSVDFVVQLDSVDTGVPDRDAHLRSADFFDVEIHPTMTFTSIHAVHRQGDSYSLFGDLELHGVKKRVTFDVVYGGVSTDPFGVTRAGFEAKTVLDRRDFNLIWNATMEAGGVLVGDTVEVTLELEATKG